MGYAISLHIGVWKPMGCRGLPTLDGPRWDALLMAEIARREGFEVVTVLLGDEADTTAVTTKITAAAEALKKAGGGTFLISFSGHGTRTERTETWCLANREWQDNELLEALKAFEENVRVLVVSASCHSGGISEGRWKRWLREGISDILDALGMEKAKPFSRSPKCDLRTRTPVDAADGIKASVLFLASCGAGELSSDAIEGVSSPLTVFTHFLWEVWKKGTATNYQDFINMIRDEVQKKTSQGPTCNTAGHFPHWFTEKPFTH
jgi:hypothetical protein